MGGDAYIWICSDYDSDISVRNFNSYWEAWRDDDMKDVKFNENSCYIKSVLYYTEESLFWNYALLFSQKTSKVCIVSSYKRDDNLNDLTSLLNSVRFE